MHTGFTTHIRTPQSNWKYSGKIVCIMVMIVSFILDFDGHFGINQVTGLISIIKTPDREEQGHYRFVIQVHVL